MIMEITLVFVLTLSLAANIFMLWYIRNLLSNMLELTDNIAGFKEEVSIYKKHLQSIYELEMFYGDETLQFLMDHTKSIGDILEDFEDVDFFLEEIEEEEEQQIQQEEENNAQTQINEENVFYAGSRRRDS